MTTHRQIQVTALDPTAYEAGSQRRQQLIDATIVAISEYGLSRTTLAKVAKLAQLSPGIVNFYFKRKDELLLATLRFLAEEFQAAVEAAVRNAKGDAARVLDALIDVHFDPAIADVRKIAVWSAFWGESQARQEYVKLCGDADAAFHETILALCRQLVDNGEQRHIDMNAIARGFEGILDGQWQEILCNPDDFDRDAARLTCRAYLASVFPNKFTMPSNGSTMGEAPAPGAAAAELNQTLAPWTYSNEEFLQLEYEHIFRRHWMLVGHVSEAPGPGDYLTLDVAGERALVVRDKNGELHAFHNVCRHRGSRVVAHDKGHCERAITCPFHGWTYDFDGTLKGVPAHKTFANLESKRGLIPLELEVWMGFIFVRFGGDGPSVNEMMKPFEAELAPYRLTQLQPIPGHFSEIMPVNWKLVHDVDNEGYHVPVAHPGLQSLLGSTYYDESHEHGVGRSYGKLVDDLSSHWSVRMYQKLLPRFEHLPEDYQRAWLYLGHFPNVSMAIYPDLIEYFQTLPLTPDKTLYVLRRYGLADERREVRAARYLNGRINQQVGAEDQRLVSWLREGMRSSVYPRNVLSDLEAGVRAFHDEIRGLLPVARLERAPPVGTLAQRNAEMMG